MNENFFKKYKIISLSPLILFLIIYLFLWSPLPERPVDPWYRAAMMLDSAAKVQDVKARSILISNAGKELHELASEHPYHARVHLLLGRYYNVVNSYDSAIVSVHRALEIGGGSYMNPIERDAFAQLSLAYFNKSNFLIKSNQLSKAIDVIKQGLKELPNDAGLYSQLAIAQHKSNDLGNAVLSYEKVLQIDPKNENAQSNLVIIYNFMANSYFGAANYEAAKANFESSLKFNPNNKEAILGLINSLEKLGDEKAANQLKQKYSQILNAR
jgi:tetratricopeptide (TPR) repeat protein